MKVKFACAVSAILIASLLNTFPGVGLQAHPLDSRSAAVQQPDQAGTALREGRRLLKRGQADQALIQLQNALNLYTTAKNNRGIGGAHNEIGELYLRQGQFQVALDHYKKALDAFVSADKKQEADVAAASMVDSRLAHANIADDKFNANLMLAKIGEVNFRLNRIPDALAAYGRMEVKKPEGAATKATRRFGGFGAIVGGISTGRASVAAPTSALTVALEAKKELDEYRVSIVYASYQLGMGRIAYANNELDAAKKYFENAREASGITIAGIANLGQTRRYRAAARTSLGDVALRQGKFKDAKDYYNQAIKGAQDDKRLDLMWPAHRGLGRTMWLQAGQEKDAKKASSLRESALASYREAVKTIETLRAGSLRADEARTTFLGTTKETFDEAVALLAEMALLGAPAGTPLSGKALEYASEAFKLTEESRARSLLDLLSEIGGAITEGVPAELLKRKLENLDRQQEIAEILTGVNVSTDENKKKPGELDAELEKLQTEYEAIENQIRIASPRYAALSSNQPLTVTEVQQKVLDDQTLLLEYNLGPEASHLWAISKTGLSLYKLPAKAELDKLATELRAQLIPAKLQRRIVGIDVVAEPERGLGIATSAPQDTAPFLAAAKALFQAAVEPAAGLMGEKRLLIVPDGALNYVPFEVLVKPSETGGDFSSLSYLIKSNEIVYSPSASVVAAIRQQRSKPVGKAMLIVADPVFNSKDTRAAKAPAPTGSGETRGLGIESAISDVTGQGAVGTAQSAKKQGLPLSRLPGTRAEAEQIAKLARGAGGQSDVWLDLEANEDNLATRELSKYRVLHIATHGLLNAERPQFTGLVLSLVGNRNSDGFLRTDEVFNMRLGSPLVMLSACETGLGKEKRGEGVMGLTRAFMYAGAPTVGVSLWSVADRSTAELMTDFYKRLLAAEQVSPPAALRNAQLTMITGKKYSAPFYWAPFVLVGDWL